MKHLAPKALTLFAGLAMTVAGGAVLLAPSAKAGAVVAQDEIKAGAFKVDPVHSSVNFKIVYMNSSHFFGRFNECDGSYLVDPDDLDNSYIDLTIKTASVDTNSQERDKHMRSGDFFASRQYPEATFVSTGAEKIDDDTILFTGDFTVRGVTNEIEVEVENIGSAQDPRANATRSGWIATVTFDRSDYNVSYGLGLLSDETELTVSMTGLQQ